MNKLGFSFTTRGNQNQQALIFLHGFLGSKEDFEKTISYLEHKFYCVSIDLISANASYPFTWISLEIESFIRTQNLTHPVLIGYSMGGRIAHVFQNLSKIPCHTIIVGAHLGIQDTQEKECRIKWEKKIEHKLNLCSLNLFIDLWYEQPIFSTFKNHASFEKILKKRKTNNMHHVKRLFNLFRLTQQPVFPPHKFSCFFCGDCDEKYLKYYTKQKIPFHKIKNSGHVIHLEHPENFAKKITEVIYETSLEPIWQL